MKDDTYFFASGHSFEYKPGLDSQINGRSISVLPLNMSNLDDLLNFIENNLHPKNRIDVLSCEGDLFPERVLELVRNVRLIDKHLRIIVFFRLIGDIPSFRSAPKLGKQYDAHTAQIQRHLPNFHINHLFSYGIDGLSMYPLEDLPLLTYDPQWSHMMNFAKLLLRDGPPKLYLIVAPSGYGKSTLIDELRYLGVRQVRKVTTRPYRTHEERSSIESVTRTEFDDRARAGDLLAPHQYRAYKYGIEKDVFERIFEGTRHHMYDTCDFPSAYILKQAHPDRVRLVALFPSIGFAGAGLEERIKSLQTPSEGFSSFTEEYEHLKKSGASLTDAHARLNAAIREARAFQRCLPYVDIILDNYNVTANAFKLIEKMVEEDQKSSEHL